MKNNLVLKYFYALLVHDISFVLVSVLVKIFNMFSIKTCMFFKFCVLISNAHKRSFCSFENKPYYELSIFFSQQLVA